MSTTDKKIENTTQPETAKADSHKAAKPAHRHKKKQHNLIPLIVVLFFAMAAGGIWLFQKVSQHHEQQQDAINDLRSKLKTSQQQTETLNNSLQEKLAQQEKLQVQQQKSQDALRDNLTTLLKRNDHLRKDWLLGEAEYLIKLASYRLQLERDVSTALRAMQAADERLHDVADPALLAVRKVLAEDQNALRNVPAADINGMSLTLSALIGSIDKLPLNTPTPKTNENTQTDQATNKNITNWKQLPNAIWQDLKGLVKIRHHDDNIATLLSPKEHFYLLQNLQLQLEQARLALLLAKGDVFSERISTAQQWLTRFFDVKDASVQNTLQTLEQLGKTNIEPEIPTIDKSYNALKNYLAGNPVVKSKPKKKLKKPVAKKTPEVKKQAAPKAEAKKPVQEEIAPKEIEQKKTEPPASKQAADTKVQL